MPDVYNDALETAPEEIVAEAGTEGAAEDAAAKASAEEAAWAAEAKARAEAKVQAAAQAEAVAKAEAKAAADAAKVALSKAEAEAAAAARLTAEQTAVKAKNASAAAKAEVAVAATASSALAAETAPLAVAGADLEAGDNGDGEKFVTVVSETAADASGRLSQLSVDDARAGLWLLSHRYVESSKSKLVAFKGHTVELAQTACAPAPEGGSVAGALWKDVQWRQMAQLPLGALYGLIALFFIAMFAVPQPGQAWMPALAGSVSPPVPPHSVPLRGALGGSRWLDIPRGRSAHWAL